MSNQCDCFAVGPYSCLEHGRENVAKRDAEENRRFLSYRDVIRGTEPAKADHWRAGLIVRLSSMWIGIHWSNTNRRLCVNFLPCLTIFVTLANGDLPKLIDYPRRWMLRK